MFGQDREQHLNLINDGRPRTATGAPGTAAPVRSLTRHLRDSLRLIPGVDLSRGDEGPITLDTLQKARHAVIHMKQFDSDAARFDMAPAYAPGELDAFLDEIENRIHLFEHSDRLRHN